MTNEQHISSESTEVEFVTFTLNNYIFGINVTNVHEIIPVVEVFKVPLSHPHIEGVISVRDEVLPVINLAKAMHLLENYPLGEERFIIAELSQQKVALHVDRTSQLYTVSTAAINFDKSSAEDKRFKGLISGALQLNNQKVLLPDFEHIIHEINPEMKKKAEV